jgi:hypothetical protein
MLAVLANCGAPTRPPPPRATFAGLPISGSIEDAKRAGFTNCLPDERTMRCRRNGVTLFGFGPFNAAVDLNGRNGGGGFDQLTMWHDANQDAFIPLGTALERQGWTMCMTGDGNKGDQVIYTRHGTDVRIMMDLSYWGKRRLRLVPPWNKQDRGC